MEVGILFEAPSQSHQDVARNMKGKKHTEETEVGKIRQTCQANMKGLEEISKTETLFSLMVGDSTCDSGMGDGYTNIKRSKN